MADVAEKPVENLEKNAENKETAVENEKEEVTSATEDNNASDEEATENLPKETRAIIRQIEYYFSDANLHRDKFLTAQISANEDGWVPLSVLITFKRLAALSTDPEVIVNALKKSDDMLVEISEDGEKLRRHPERPLPEFNVERRKEIQSRSAYVKGFPLVTDISQILDFFAPFEKVVNVYMRKYLDKPTKTYKFKGSCFVTFEKREQASDFIEKEKVLFENRELVRKWQTKYFEDKQLENQKKSEKKHAKQAKQAKAAKPEIELPNGAVLHFEGAKDGVSREGLREAVEKIGSDSSVAYIEYNKGDAAGYIRFQEENTAGNFFEKLDDGKLKITDEIELTLRVLKDEEETEFLKKAIEQMKNKRNQSMKFKNNRKRRFGADDNHGKKKKFNDNE